MQYPREHLHCGGTLNFARSEVVTVTVNKKAMEKYGAKAIIKQHNKDLYKCDKCDMLVNVIDMPSWEEYVLMGRIRIEKWKYLKLRKEYDMRRKKEQTHGI